MKTVLGKLNSTFLVNLLAQSHPVATSISAAIAYADYHEPLIDHLRRHPETSIKFYGRMDHEGAVSLRLLEWFLKHAPATAECYLVNGRYHPKVIWWHGFGAYIGSANLTRNGWERNVEAGLFLTEDELEESGTSEQLDTLFEELERISLRLTDEVYAKLSAVESERKKLQPGLDAVKRRFDDLLGSEKPYAGQTVVTRPGERRSKAQQTFVDEWRDALQLMRSLCREFAAMKKRPRWVSEGANSTVHFDQFLHGYYYHLVLKTLDEGNSAGKVEQLHERNKANPGAALRDAASWWASLSEAPSKARYDEEAFIRERAPRAQVLFSAASLDNMDEAWFVEALSNVYAFREHARQIERSFYGLPPDHHESEDQRAERFARWLWTQRTEGGKTPVDVLRFVIHGAEPADAVHRIWLATRDPKWRLPRVGKSSYGEALGWARPDDYPPRNDRTNKALRALGYDVRIFNR
jgi:hypothetical protein